MLWYADDVFTIHPRCFFAYAGDVTTVRECAVPGVDWSDPANLETTVTRNPDSPGPPSVHTPAGWVNCSGGADNSKPQTTVYSAHHLYAETRRASSSSGVGGRRHRSCPESHSTRDSGQLRPTVA